VINSILPEGSQILDTRGGGVRVVNNGSLTSGKRPGNASNVKQSPNSRRSPPVASPRLRPGSAPARIRASPKSKTKSANKQNNNRQTPRTVAPRTVARTPKTVAPRTATPKTATPKTATPKTATPKTATPKTAAPGTVRGPRTRPKTVGPTPK
jgi:hypothetical protein